MQISARPVAQPVPIAKRVQFDRQDNVRQFHRSDAINDRYDPRLAPRKSILKLTPRERIRRDLMMLSRTIPARSKAPASAAQKIAMALGVLSISSLFMIGLIGPFALVITGFFAAASFFAWGYHKKHPVSVRRYWDESAEQALRINLSRRDPILDLRGYVFRDLPRSLRTYRHLKYVIIDCNNSGLRNHQFGHIQLISHREHNG